MQQKKDESLNEGGQTKKRVPYISPLCEGSEQVNELIEAQSDGYCWRGDGVCVEWAEP